MKLLIECTKCYSNVVIRDGYNNDKGIKLHIVGDQLIEIKYSKCDGSITIVDGEL